MLDLCVFTLDKKTIKVFIVLSNCSFQAVSKIRNLGYTLLCTTVRVVKNEIF